MAAREIVIRGASEHNLKRVNLTLPRNKLIVITGVSGSGKSSLAFDTLYAEGQRRYVESLSAYARQFLEQMEKPDVESIEGLSPAISIEQKTTSRNPRSTVGTVTEIYDYLRLLFARIGEPHCHECGRPIRSQSVQQIVDGILDLPHGARIQVLAPIVRGRKGTYRKEFREAARQGFVRARVDGEIRDLSDDIDLDKKLKHNIEIVVDRLVIKKGLRGRLTDSVETALEAASGLVVVDVAGRGDLLFSRHLACTDCGVSVPEMEPRLFSFNSPFGACPKCDGLGVSKSFSKERILLDPAVSLRDGALAWGYANWSQVLENSLYQAYEVDPGTPYKKLPKKFLKVLWEGAGTREFDFRWQGKRSAYHWKGKWEGIVPSLTRRYKGTESQTKREAMEKLMAIRPCEDCQGMRLKPEALAVTVGDLNISRHTELSVEEAVKLYRGLKFGKQDSVIAKPIMKEILERLGFLANVGLGYLTLDRSAATLSGGEGQRIRLATQIGSRLTGVLYILDEPSIGLHQRDNRRLLDTLQAMRDLGNTVVVVEHDEETIRAADFVVDLGPGAGELGGEVVCAGTPKQVQACRKSLTGAFLSGREAIAVPERRRQGNARAVEVLGAAENNLKGLDVRFPLGLFTCVTGVSGSGKSTLVNQILHRALARALHGVEALPGKHREVRGVEHIDKIIDIDQSPIGRTPRSNPATYVGLFTPIRELFSQVPESRMRGYKPGRFSFNVRGGRCEACEGGGVLKIEMHFLPDVYVTCDTCGGRRYNRETLEVLYKGRNIAEVLEMTIHQGLDFFDAVPKIKTKLATLQDVGLGYLRLGQPATTLSGGEAQRIKLSKELSRRATGKTLYLLDEPTTGLHFEDIRKLLAVLNRLVDQGNSLVVIEHNLDVIKTADWVIDLGPEGGGKGGKIVAQGTPEAVAKVRKSQTGQLLKQLLGQ
ncbi:MAG: excinuclease ABC subunit UvrA [Acidobacteria bacterium]|uniref:UvrABC system protein A n=1 Tax=Candidatus Polarisedimenticola svalbardensis TaxID=2886004 RepID=A0A8J6Y1K8_9BACT|nr:excinuclease ABC subunit UvrA [Candidatus Polarisedimenticola svalbardensis]